MNVVVDTNVVISGLFWKGPPSDVLSAWLDRKFTWVVSPDILAEYHRTLRSVESKYLPPASAWGFLRGVSLSAKLVVPVLLEQQVCSDPDDDKFLTTAMAGNANIIVSGDKALLCVDGYHGLQIVKPAAFLKELNYFVKLK
jgi:uncharacterized protein